MKKAILFIAIFTVITIFKAVANDSCVIYINKQVIFKGTVDREEAVATIKAKEIKGTDSIKIVYYSESSNKGWRRTFYIQDSTEQNLKTIELGKQSGSVTFSASVLRAAKEKKKPIFIYTISLPI